MSFKNFRSLIFFSIFLLFNSVSNAALTKGTEKPKNNKDIKKVVLFPLNNLTSDYTAQIVISPLIEENIRKRGFEIVSPEIVDQFLIKRRIRNTSTINSAKALEVKKELGADAVLLGSIDQFSEEQNEKVAGVTLRLVSTTDCTIIWMDTLSFKGTDFKGILGIGSIHSADKLASRIVTDITGNIPHNYDYDEGSLNLYEMESVRISPQITGAGKEINISTRIVQLFDNPKSVKAFVNGQSIDLKQTKGKLYSGMIDSLKNDGIYPVDIIVEGAQGEVANFSSVAEVTIDTLPPVVDLETNKVTTGGGGKREAIVFSIRPHDPIARWEVHILNKENKTVRWGKGYGTLPSKVIWRGEDDFGRKNRDGIYTFRLTVWDKADNQATYVEDVRLDSTPPTVNIEVDPLEGNEVVFKLDYDENEAMEDWSFVVVYGETTVVKKITGKGNIDNEIRISLKDVMGENEENDNSKVVFTLKVTDIAGNTFETSGEKFLYASKKWKKFSQKMDNEEWGVVDF